MDWRKNVRKRPPRARGLGVAVFIGVGSRRASDAEGDTDGVGSSDFVGVYELSFLIVEEVVGVEEELAGLDGLVADFEVDSAAG